MNLSFECSQDPRKMPTIGGKKFCAQCQKNVFDLRRKSDAKVAAFYEENPNACAIAYQEQLDKLPERKIKRKQPNHFLPYAASFVAAALLPSLTIAQINSNSNSTAQTVIGANKNAEGKVLENSYKDYYIEGRVKITDKKLKIKAGREFSFHSNGEDSLLEGKIGLGGYFKIKVSKEVFDRFDLGKEGLYLSIDGIAYSRLEELETNNNVITLTINSRTKRVRMMGKF